MTSFVLRPYDEKHDDFLFDLYASTRAEELEAWGWTDQQRELFLRQQYEAQRQSYDLQFEDADHQIIVAAGQPIGRMMVSRDEDEYRLIDISLLPPYRGAGIGTQILRGLLREGFEARKPVCLSVLRTNPAARLYARLGFAVTDDDGDYDDATGATPTFSAAGLDGPDTVSVGIEVTDDGGLTDTTTAEIQVANVAPSISATPQTQGVQYSDRIVDVTVSATDVAADVLSASTSFDVDGGGFGAGLPCGLSLTANGCTVTGTNQTCTWTVSGIADEPAGTYTIRVTSQDDDGGSGDVDITLNVSPEDATVTFDGGNPVALQVESDGGNSGSFLLVAHVMEFDDPFAVAGDSKLAGDIVLASVSISLVPVGPGSAVPPSGACSGVISAGIADPESAFDYDILTITCPFDDVPVNAYTLQVDVNVNGFYTGSGEDVLTIFDPSLGFTTGGGTFFWPGTNDRTNFGFNVRYSQNGNGAKGSLLLIRHLSDGTIFRLKSNKMSALAIGEESGADPFG